MVHFSGVARKMNHISPLASEARAWLSMHTKITLKYEHQYRCYKKAFV
ncbi:MAG: hypothetical protein U5L45_06100 [Saprospiraceae bacterium]|nr:hypothetical protein [Saprospiraceae bacterium]